MKKKLYLFLFIGMLLFIGGSSQRVEADTELMHPKKVLIVYDSLKQGTDVSKNIHSLERLLSSFKYQVTAESMNDYKKGQIQKENYDAVITMINWAAIPLENHDFYKDQAQYKGKTLHIGRKMTKEEKARFPNNWEEVYQQEVQVVDGKKRYDEIIGFAQDLLLPIDITQKETIVSYLNVDRGKGKRETYPFSLIYKNAAFLPFYYRSGAAFLSATQLIAKWLGIDHNYDPYIAILGFSPLSNMSVAKKFIAKLETLENEIILSCSSSATNTDLKTFKVYLQLLHDFTLDKRSVIYLNTPALNNVGETNNQLLNIIQQEVSTLVEHGILPLGISALDYWNFDNFYQNSALNFANATLLYEFDKTPVYHQQVKTANTYPLMFYNIDYKDLENINWHINGKYTEFTFDMPTTISYPFPNSEKQMNKIIKNILADPFPPTDYYLYQFDTGISTQTQLIRGYRGMITLNGEPIVNIDFAKMNERRENNEKNQKKMEKQASTTVEKTAMNRLNDWLIVIISVTLLILAILTIIGRRRYLSMFKRHKLHHKEEDHS